MLEIFCGFFILTLFFLALFSFYRHTIETNRLDYEKNERSTLLLC